MYTELDIIRFKCKVHVIAFEYPGYGCSVGSPNETSINDRIRDVFSFLREEWKVQTKHIILFGRSIGTGPCAMLASECYQNEIEIGGLILQSPYKSIKEIVRELIGKVAASFVMNRWNNELEIVNVKCPVLFIHGKMDELIPSEHSRHLYTLCASHHKTLEMPELADHNNFDLEKDILIPVAKFLIEECPRSPEFMLIDIDLDLSSIPSNVKSPENFNPSPSPFRIFKKSIQSSTKVLKDMSKSVDQDPKKN